MRGMGRWPTWMVKVMTHSPHEKGYLLQYTEDAAAVSETQESVTAVSNIHHMAEVVIWHIMHAFADLMHIQSNTH